MLSKTLDEDDNTKEVLVKSEKNDVKTITVSTKEWSCF